jgi:hypothetical protein
VNEESSETSNRGRPGPGRVKMVVALGLVAFLVAISLVAATMNSSRPSGGLTTTTVSPRTTYPTKNLPPSRDNDAGRARSIDVTPDNDTDAWQRG